MEIVNFKNFDDDIIFYESSFFYTKKDNDYIIINNDISLLKSINIFKILNNHIFYEKINSSNYFFDLSQSYKNIDNIKQINLDFNRCKIMFNNIIVPNIDNFFDYIDYKTDKTHKIEQIYQLSTQASIAPLYEKIQNILCKWDLHLISTNSYFQIKYFFNDNFKFILKKNMKIIKIINGNPIIFKKCLLKISGDLDNNIYYKIKFYD